MKNEKLEGVTRGDKLCKSRGGEKFVPATGHMMSYDKSISSEEPVFTFYP